MKKKTFPFTMFLAAGLSLTCAWMVREPSPDTNEFKALTSRFQFSKQNIAKPKPSDKKIFDEIHEPFANFIRAFLPVASTFFEVGHYRFLCVADSLNATVTIHTFQGNAPKSAQVLNLDSKKSPTGTERPSACLQGDWNRDGLSDLIVGFWGRSPLLLITKATTTGESYEFEWAELTEKPEVWYTQSIASGDVDGDGSLDLIIANYFADNAKILLNGPGTSPSMNNGWNQADNGGANRLYLGQKEQDAPLFREDVKAFAPFPKRWTIAIGIADLDSDLLPEVIFLNDHGPNTFFHNRSTPGKPEFALIVNESKFDTPKSKILGRDDFHGMGIDFGDMNNDGNLDWGVSNFGADFAFHQSHFTWIHSGDMSTLAQGKAPFFDMSEPMGLARTREIPWDLRYADFDNDGVIEVFQSIGFVRGEKNWTPFAHELALQNDLIVEHPLMWHRLPDDYGWAGNGPNAFFVRGQNGRYTDIGAELGFQEQAVSRGIATTDINRDGHIDFFVGNQQLSDSFYVNNSPSDNKFLALEISLLYEANIPDAVQILDLDTLPSSPYRDAVGAMVTLLNSNGSKTVALVDGGSGFGGKKHRFVHFGLGKNTDGEELRIKIDWRDERGQPQSKLATVTPGWHRLVLGQKNGLASALPQGGNQ